MVKSPTEPVKRIQIKCNSCNGMMDIDKERPILLCPYCGSKELIIESDKVTAQRIKSSTYKEVEFKKQKTYREVELGKRELEIKGDKSRFIQRLIGFGIVIAGIVITYYSNMVCQLDWIIAWNRSDYRWCIFIETHEKKKVIMVPQTLRTQGMRNLFSKSIIYFILLFTIYIPTDILIS